MRRLLLTGAVAAAIPAFAVLSAGASRGAGPDVVAESAPAGLLAVPFAPSPDGEAPDLVSFVGARAGEAAGAPAALRPPASFALPEPQQYLAEAPGENHAFYFTRGIYSSYRGWGRRGGSWATDWPKSDRQFNVVLKRLTNIDSYLEPNAVALDDPALLRFPYVYILEVGRISLSPGEITNLRDYLLKGGFLFVDDFWGNNEWYPFEDAMRQVLPEFPIEKLPLDHEYFHTFYQVDEIHQVPNVSNARWGVTSECGGCYAEVFGIFDDKRRLMVVINWNTDLGDAWEWAEQPDYPVRYSTYAFEVGVNAIIYAMSH